MIDQLADARRQKETQQKNKKNDLVLHNLLLQLTCQPNTPYTLGIPGGIINLCTTISLIDQVRIEERANRQAKITIKEAHDHLTKVENKLEINEAHPEREK